ncbi:hypothetical protein [Halorarum salinum]|nr:hypothetical protein [Halobaculum salinum]
MYEDDFEGRLGRTVLEAFAHDVDVAGRRLLTHEDPGVPDVEVVITAIGSGPTDAAESTGKAEPTAESERAGEPGPAERAAAGTGEPAGRRAAFEAGLSDLILAAYAEQDLADPAGTWTLSFPSTSVPDWSVEVTIRTADGREVGSRSNPDGPSRPPDR